MATNSNPVTVGKFLAWSTTLLAESDIPTARLDSLILLEDTLGINRARLLAHLELELSDVQKEKLEELIKQRQQHTPLAYLRGKAEFYGRTFVVTRETLVPRPETEDMITLLKSVYQGGGRISIADVGTGTGCLGITAALELSNSTIDLYDIDAAALLVAQHNAQLYTMPARYYEEDLLSEARRREYDVILANLPYVSDEYTINQSAKFEPKLALFSGLDGLDDYRIFWSQLGNFETKPRHVITESEPATQHRALVALASKIGFKIQRTRGFIQLFSLINQ
jgi:release factor glutamine methyltransferase